MRNLVESFGNMVCCYSVTKLSDSLQPHVLQCARLPCPSLSSGVCSCPLSWWYHPTISSSVAPSSSCPQSFPESGSFPVSQLFESVSAKYWSFAFASILPINIQGWFTLGLAGLISLQSKRLSRVFSSTTVWKHQFFTESVQKKRRVFGIQEDHLS